MQGVEKIHIADCTARLYYSVKVGHNTLKMDGKSPLTASAEVCEEAWFIKQKTSRDNHMLPPSHGTNGNQRAHKP